MDATVTILLIAGLITGFSKFSVGGMGMLVLPIIMIAFPGPEALAVMLPLYVITDIMAIYSYREHIKWSVLLRLMPLAFLGVLIGASVLSSIDATQFMTILGVMILAMMALGVYLDMKPATFMQSPLAAYIMGFFGGTVSMLANAAGPIYSLYFLEQKLSKESYVSTRAWAFCLINLSKLPMYLLLGLFTQESLQASIYALPGLAIGIWIGYHFLKKVKPTHFKWVIRILSAMAAFKLFVFS
ncbi:sulfite exporter TauE/SafE family protein [Marinomonas mediterranea]|jgi:Sulfite exporter TauE/SafE.|uniref:Probable membrane transporter protein n=1 Tax=Marinomonas mediterranea (strain ATCC 700492 / JCM 21426 / NBRC 103028 / MMB-1) TaxID=717774 RepID=F2JXP6_MARM1|nr:sulfite exporter TauE/SafE family protein [Marinomonas mediterranea]ADZ93044.1 protein of unknown function DUF81 [Marinomonas mediterranea MMB-1]WCN10953.1 TSUP family transporter [Marinomonas mediterranea]WCN15015.1 TSUP family transporter [Marinomonas mediterranea]WCN19059.1 TSUP family transporter [Marinomonas mediterranea MMB-1]